MKTSYNLLIILSAVFSVWGIVDIYNYFTIGKEALLFYEGVDILSQLVKYNLNQGVARIVLGMCLLLIMLIRNRTRSK